MTHDKVRKVRCDACDKRHCRSTTPEGGEERCLLCNRTFRDAFVELVAAHYAGDLADAMALLVLEARTLQGYGRFDTPDALLRDLLDVCRLYQTQHPDHFRAGPWRGVELAAAEDPEGALRFCQNIQRAERGEHVASWTGE